MPSSKMMSIMAIMGMSGGISSINGMSNIFRDDSISPIEIYSKTVEELRIKRLLKAEQKRNRIKERNLRNNNKEL